MPTFQLFIPGDAHRGSSIAREDFAAAADELLAEHLQADESISDELKEQATAAVKAAKALVAAGHAGSERVVCVISSRVNPDAIPAGTGHIVSIELSSRAQPPAAEPSAEEVAASESSASAGEEAPKAASRSSKKASGA